MVITRHGGGHGFDSGSGVGPSYVELCEFVMYGISQAILETTPVMFG